MSKITVQRIPHIDTLVIKKSEDSRFFYSTDDSIIISPSSLAFLINFLVQNEFISHKMLEGILEEYHSS